MRITIRHNNIRNHNEDVETAMAAAEIDESGTYHWEMVINIPGSPTMRREEIVSGVKMRNLLRSQLHCGMHEFEQNEPGQIFTRWTRLNKRNNYRTQYSVFTRIPAPSMDVPEHTPEINLSFDEPVPAHVTEPADEIELVAEAGDASDALDLSRQLIRAGHTKWAIDVRRAVTRDQLDRNMLRKLAKTVALQLADDYREARTLAAIDAAA
ncbi:hypothetical protein [Streptomyces parvulus]|uniref:hypothetical protein n=1 Tax=Streptomyces parvulus TaxID=146923 RepID=UPI0037F73140